MREKLRSIGVPDGLGLAYGPWAPMTTGGKIADRRWFDELSSVTVAADYARAFERWTASFRARGDRKFELVLAGRLLVGHGNASATDVGLTVHHTWGVPMIPGSALKGLLAHHVDAVYGPTNTDLPAWEQAEGVERERARYQGVTRRGRRILWSPGDVYRALFGAPDAEGDIVARASGHEAGAASGLVTFHDALYVPGSAAGDQPFCADVLTVHQPNYYRTSGASWPNDYDSPNPVAFLTVRPRVRMLFALSGPADWTELAERLLVDALQEWGAGGKTSAGYGRLMTAEEARAIRGEHAGSSGAPADAARPRPRPRHRRGDRITVTRVEDPAGRGKVKFRVAEGFLGHFAGENPPEVGIGETAEVWVANVSPQGYTLTLRPPKERKR